MRRPKQKSLDAPPAAPGGAAAASPEPRLPPAQRPRIRRRDGVQAAPPRAPLEIVRARELALTLVAAGAPRSLVLRTMREELRITEVQAIGDYNEVCAELRAEFEASRASLKAQQVERLMRDLARMRAAGNVSYRNIAAHEALLARVTGTIEPVRVEAHLEADLRESFVAVLAGLGQAEQDRLIEEQLQLEARAGSLDTEGEPVG